jgi:thiamine transport system ATP-binding protein
VSSSECLEVRGLVATWGAAPVLRGVDLDVAEHEFVVLMGPNGSGKTTLLRCLVGLEPIVAGSVRLRGRPLDGVPTHRRGIGMLFQEPALFPRRSVWENVAYGLGIARRPRPEVERRVEEMLGLLHLGALADRGAEELSGGERQRVALARTLAPEPPLVLLDEPFASVDAEIRRELRSEFRAALRATGTAAVHVTHDREEGLLLADRVVLLSDGAVVQAGPPQDVYERPRSPSAARFLGYNLIRSEGANVAVVPEDVEVMAPTQGAPSGTVTLDGRSARVRVREVTLEDGTRIEVRGETANEPVGSGIGARVSLRWARSVRFADDGPSLR